MPLSTTVTKLFKTSIMDSLQNDSVSLAIRNDKLIVKYGERKFSKCAGIHQYSYVRQKMRELGRFLIEMRKINKDVSSLSDCCKPSRFKEVVDAVKVTSRFDESKSTFDIPSLALKLGYSLKSCADILKSTAILNEDAAQKQKALEFLELCTSEWNSSVSSQALRTLSKRKLNNPQRLPLATDIRKMNAYLENKSNELSTSVSSGCVDSWRELAEVMLARLVLFNRRRGGETERMELSQYEAGMAADGEDIREEVLDSLSAFEKELVHSINRVEIIGKRGRRVAVLLTKEHTVNMDILNNSRTEAGVTPDNKYVFARIGSTMTPLRSVDVLRKFADICGASKPELLTSTTLRKHIATVSQIISLKENEMDSLANFLGHDIRIHREYYRLPENTFQVAKISKILIGLEKGSLRDLKGKSLDDIEMAADELVDENECDDDDDEIDIVESDAVADQMSLDPIEEGTSVKTPRLQQDKKVKRKMWSNAEKSAMKKQLGKYFKLETLPGKIQCEQAQLMEPCLRDRPWKQLKYFIKNHKYQPN